MIAAITSCDAGAETLYAVVLGNPKFVVGSSTLHSGLFASRDGGRSWTHMGPENLKAYSMDGVDASGGGTLYIAAGNGVHKSTDSGRSWKIVTDWRITEVLDVKVDQRNPGRVFAATAYGFWVSTDGGASWDRPIAPPAEGYIYRLAYRDRQVIILGDSGVSRFEPEIGVGTFSSEDRMPAPRALVEIPPFGTIVSTVGSPTLNRLAYLRSPDPYASGSLPRAPGPRERGLARALLQAPTMNIYDLLLSGSPDSMLYAAGDAGVHAIPASFASSWKDLTGSLPNRMVHALAWLPSSGTLMAGTFGDGVFRRERSGWVAAGLDGGQIWRLVVKPW